jgi:hippurate hydrolase
MPVIPQIADYGTELTAIRRDLHAHPELGFEEVRTSGIVSKLLHTYGVDEVHTGLGGTGVVGVIQGKQAGPSRIGIRADMDALPIHETTNLPYASKNPGVMHACGHDGHTTMLLGAAKYLAETRNFAGTALLIFQPAEEGLGGARRMISEGLFEKFPCDEIYGMHNNPTADPGIFAVKPGAAMAGASFFDITVRGVGSHAAMPQDARDALVIASALVGELQTIVSRNVPPTKPAVLSVTQINAGSAYNVVPDTATLAGTIRYFHDEVSELMNDRLRTICAGFAKMHGIEIDVDIRNIFDVLMNDPALSDAYLEAAQDVVGNENASLTEAQATGSEDFADMLRVVPGSYCTLGHAGSIPVHNPEYVMDDDALPIGASIMARIVERRMAVAS